ncbi:MULTISPECIES: sensor histidine kinase [unclassified Nocardioides]|uniref:sensor histidine kinase n=1 Tax=unclassified Nocardioides TaxID=2615069 RepID=UPI000A272833|nr:MULTISPECIES: HAMP domain-containing sensor histidine kinase [unclassified Nocardioides]
MSRENSQTTPVSDPQTSWSDAPSRDALQLIAEGVTQLAGFGVAAISVVRADGRLEVMAVAGSDAARQQLQGTRTPVDRLNREIAKADDWGLLRFVPHERLDPGAGEDWGWVPDIEPIDAPDAWHPLDLLIAPLYVDGTLRGTLAIDLPVDGRRPGAAQRAVLNSYAEQAGRAVVVALEREALAEQVRMAEAARLIVRRATAQLSLDRIVADSRGALLDGFRAAGMWLQAFESSGRSAIYSADGDSIELGPEMVAIAERAARAAWDEQRAVVVAQYRGFADTITPEEIEQILAFIADIGVESLLFTPIGAGPECLGNLVLTRPPGAPAWTEAEAATALDIGHDLGRAILNARTFEREHQLVEELQALDTYKGQLIATVAHELKNPLTSVLGHLEMLESSPDLSGTTQSSLNAMGRGARRMVRVIDDLLLLAKVGDADNPIIAAPVDLHRLVDEVVDLTMVAAEQKGIDVRVVAPAEPVLALGDPDELDTVCANLVSNAVKYTPHGGVVTITVSRTDEAVVLSVADEGIGIAAADVARLGTEFFRSTNPAAVAQPGTGLGLAIARRVVDRHHGRLEIESELGRGSTFRVILPAAPL